MSVEQDNVPGIIPFVNTFYVSLLVPNPNRFLDQTPSVHLPLGTFAVPTTLGAIAPVAIQPPSSPQQTNFSTDNPVDRPRQSKSRSSRQISSKDFHNGKKRV
jgi:hypothetical protein